MAVKPGNKFVFGDLGGLLATANSRSSSLFDLSGYYDVSPMNDDPSGNKYGYRQLGNFKVTARGTGYKQGDMVEAPGSSASFEVVAVDANGGIVGLLILSNGGFAPGSSGSGWETANDPAPGAFLNLSSSGSGARLSFTVGHAGPEQAYVMTDYANNMGSVTDLILNQAGNGYQVGDVLVVPSLSFPADGTVQVTVNAVDGSGAITSFAASGGILGFTTNLILVPTDISVLAVTGGHGSGATFSGLFVLQQKPAWLTELNRLRGNISALMTIDQSESFMNALSPATICVSGPWPVTAPTANFEDTWFYFADTGMGATVTVVSNFTPCSTGPFSTKAVYSYYSYEWTGLGYWGDFVFEQPIPPNPPDPGWQIGQIIGGGAYRVIADTYDGFGAHYYDAVPGPPGFASGLTATALVDLFATRAELSFIIGGPIAIHVSGIAYVQFQVTSSGQTVVVTGGGSGTTPSTVTTPDSTNPADLVTVDGASTMPGTISKLVGGIGSGGLPMLTVVCALNQSLAPGKYTLILNIACPDDSHDQWMYIGMGTDEYGRPYNDYSTMETRVTTTTRTRVQALGLGQAQPFLSGAAAYTLNASYNNAFTPTGFLTASTTYSSAVPTAGIHNSKQIFKIQLPGDALGNGSGIGTVTQYAITAGPFGGVSGWMPLTGYATGAIIVDSNGNIQQLTVNSGQSSGTTPNWATTLNGLTTDGSMGWTLINLKSAPNWQVAPYPQPIMGPEKDVISGVSITTSTPGFWTAKCQPICSLNIATAEMMPWNQNRTKYGSAGSASVNPMLLGDQAPIASTGPLANQAQVSGSYDQSKTVEGQLEPPVWKANTFFPPNFTILDPNGNLQKSGTGAVSGATAPSFANTKGVFTYDGGAPGPGTLVWNCIKVLKPASTWEAAQAYAVGQTVIDANGSAETVKTAGTSGGSAPNWSTVPDGLTTDGSVTWRRTSAWLLTAPVATIAPAQHRVPDIPRYPFYWFSETLARLKPPTNTSGPTIWGTNNQWQLNYYTGGYDAGWHQCYPASAGTPADTGGMAYGWFIYSVSINRNQYPVKTRQAPKAVGAGDLNTWWAGDDTGASGVGAGGAGTGPNAGPITDASEISVTIGCIRNGAFVSFGSFQTGQTYQVLWPVFTSDALVYQASERLDLQAMAITDGNSVGIGTVTPPVCAAFITDTINILNLIN